MKVCRQDHFFSADQNYCDRAIKNFLYKKISKLDFCKLIAIFDRETPCNDNAFAEAYIAEAYNGAKS